MLNELTDSNGNLSFHCDGCSCADGLHALDLVMGLGNRHIWKYDILDTILTPIREGYAIDYYDSGELGEIRFIYCDYCEIVYSYPSGMSYEEGVKQRDIT